MELADDALTGRQIDPDSYAAHTLKNELQRRHRIPAGEVTHLAWNLVSALESLHVHGLVHRDIKPANIIFVYGRPKLADVGLVTDADLTRTRAGTEGYMPPEGPGTFRADVYSLGMTLYEAMTGLHRSDFPALPENNSEFEDHDALLRLNRIIAKACQPEPRRRYQSAAEMRRDFEACLHGHSGRRRWILAASAAVLLTSAVAAAVLARTPKLAARGWTGNPRVWRTTKIHRNLRLSTCGHRPRPAPWRSSPRSILPL